MKRMRISPVGWRARIGIIYPASGLADMEYFDLCPPGVSVHITRTSVPREGSVTLEDMTELAEGKQLQQLARDLATVKPNAVAWMCTSGSFSKGPLWDEQMCRMLSEYACCPATSTSASVVEALRALSIRKVAVGTPYEPRLDEKLKQYLAHYGLEVVGCVGLELTRDWDIGTLDALALNDLVRGVDSEAAEAIFISDTGIVLSPLAGLLEADLGKPVFSANMATMWHSLRLAGVKESLPGFGRLFAVNRLPQD
jgi:maleate cis-trans isomerase